jgi:peptide/nickel transport system ATP-binding protein
MADILKVSNLNTEFKSDYGSKQALKNISFNIKDGEVLALVGESGSGKTVTSLSIMGLLPNNASVQEGEIKLVNKNNNEINILNLSDEQHNEIRGNDISMVFQEPMTCLNPTMTVGEQILEVILRHKKISKSNAQKEVIDLLNLVEIPDPVQRAIEYPHQLSGGMRQRIMIAISLACNPKLIIADEPTSALDVTIQAQLLELLKKLKNSIVTKTSILFITHDLGIVKELADRVIVMYQGEIVEEGNVTEVFQRPKHAYTNNLIQSLPEFKIEERKKNNLKNNIKNNDDPIILSIKNLYKEFPVEKGMFKKSIDTVKAVQNISLNVKQNKVLGLVGESGSGKTTLGRSIIRLIEPSAGEILYNDKNIIDYSEKEMRKLRKDFQIIFQDPYASLDPRKKIFNIISQGLKIHTNMNKQEIYDKVMTIIKDVGLQEEHLNRYPHEFSGGQRQRIGIARALVLDPKFIIADEPVSALDVTIQAQILNLILELKEKYSLTILFISHDLSVINQIGRFFSIISERTFKTFINCSILIYSLGL